ncbi:MAG: DotU family type IV/VI secretion system protein [Pirellulaceae bacterium]
MREQIAKIVHPVIAHGLQLQQRLRGGESPDLEHEQTTLKDLLLSDFESLRWRDFGGDAAVGRAEGGERGLTDDRQHAGDHFLGVRYALVCWLDELFCNETPWGQQWNENKLEMELYGTNDRAWRFWEQAKIARSRPGSDALEVCYLCVVLGFRGQLRDQPERLEQSLQSARRRLGKVRELEWKYAADFDPPCATPPLWGRDRLRRMAVTAWISLLIFIPTMSFLLIRRLGG